MAKVWGAAPTVLQHPSARPAPYGGRPGPWLGLPRCPTRGASAFRAVPRADRLAPLRGTVPKRARVRSDAGCKHKRLALWAEERHLHRNLVALNICDRLLTSPLKPNEVREAMAPNLRPAQRTTCWESRQF